MRACIQETVLSPISAAAIHDDKYDHRFFHYTEDGTGHCLTGEVREIALCLLQKHTPSFLDGHSWIRAATKAASPLMRRLLLTQLCMSRIASRGLKCVDPRLQPMAFLYYDATPPWVEARLIRESIVRCLLIPGQNCDALVDGIIFYLDKKEKTLELILIQVGSTKESVCIDEVFYSQRWKDMKQSLLSTVTNRNSLSLRSSFIFLPYGKVPETPSEESKKAVGEGWELEYSCHTLGLTIFDDVFDSFV